MTWLLLALACTQKGSSVDSSPEVTALPGIVAGEARTLVESGRLLTRIAYHPDGYLLAVDHVGDGTWGEPAGTEVLRIDLDGAVSTWAEGLERPYSLAVGPDGEVAVLSDRVPEYPQRSRLWTWGPEGAREPILVPDAYYVGVHPEGGALVADSNRGIVYHYAEAGEEPEELEDECMEHPYAFGVDPDGETLWVFSEGPYRLCSVDPAGRATLRYEFDWDSLGPAVVTARGVFFSDYGRRRVYRLAADGSWWRFLDVVEEVPDTGHGTPGWPRDIAATPDGRTLWTLDTRGVIYEIEVLGDP